VPTLKNTETSKINNLMMYLKLIEKKKNKPNSKPADREIMKIRAENNEIETKQTIQRINETKS
jgi:hypothetical protein